VNVLQIIQIIPLFYSVCGVATVDDRFAIASLSVNDLLNLNDKYAPVVMFFQTEFNIFDIYVVISSNYSRLPVNYLRI